jgi:hypothetical protein
MPRQDSPAELQGTENLAAGLPTMTLGPLRSSSFYSVGFPPFVDSIPTLKTEFGIGVHFYMSHLIHGTVYQATSHL